MTVEEYIQYRMGTSRISLIIRNMFVKPFFAASLRSFWNYWNPGFGFYLLYYVYKPMRNVSSHWVSLIVTFLVCGLLHDLIYVVPLLMMDGITFIFPYITFWFFIISIGILIAERVPVEFKTANKKLRPVFHLGYLIVTFCLTRFFDLLIG